MTPVNWISTTVTPLMTLVIVRMPTGAPVATFTTSNAPALMTICWANVTVMLLIIDRWAEPSLTDTSWLYAAIGVVLAATRKLLVADLPKLSDTVTLIWYSPCAV